MALAPPPPTATTDRKCSDSLTQCSTSQYVSAEATPTTDRECSGFPSCGYGFPITDCESGLVLNANPNPLERCNQYPCTSDECCVRPTTGLPQCRDFTEAAAGVDYDCIDSNYRGPITGFNPASTDVFTIGTFVPNVYNRDECANLCTLSSTIECVAFWYRADNMRCQLYQLYTPHTDLVSGSPALEFYWRDEDGCSACACSVCGTDPAEPILGKHYHHHGAFPTFGSANTVVQLTLKYRGQPCKGNGCNSQMDEEYGFKEGWSLTNEEIATGPALDVVVIGQKMKRHGHKGKVSNVQMGVLFVLSAISAEVVILLKTQRDGLTVSRTTFDVSCNATLKVGDIFGPFEVVDFQNAAGGTISDCSTASCSNLQASLQNDMANMAVPLSTCSKLNSLLFNVGGPSVWLYGRKWHSDSSIFVQDPDTAIVGDAGNTAVPGCDTAIISSAARQSLVGAWRETSAKGLDLSYSIPVVGWPGIYTVVFHFSAAAHQQQPRTFDVVIEGMVVAAAYNPHASSSSGNGKDVMLTIPGVATADRTIDIKLVRLLSAAGAGPTLSMLEIHSGSCTPVPVDVCEGHVSLPLPVTFAVPLPVRTSEVAAVFSCQELGWEPLPTSKNTICRQSKIQGACYMKKKSFADASEMCRSEGARLCTADELHFEDVGKQNMWNACNLKKSPIWSSTPCTTKKDPSMSAYVVAAGPTKARKSYCKPVARNGKDLAGSLQCCADVTMPQAVGAGSSSSDGASSTELSASTCTELRWKVKFVHSEKTTILSPGNGVGLFSRKVCGQSKIEGHECRTRDIRFAEAKKICTAAGSRLCTSTEIRNGATKGTGCLMGNATWVWTQTECHQPGVNGPSFLVERAAPLADGSAGLCWPTVGPPYAQAGMQCCADWLVSSKVLLDEDAGGNANQIISSEEDDEDVRFAFEIKLAISGAAVAIMMIVVATILVYRRQGTNGKSRQQSSKGPQTSENMSDLDWDNGLTCAMSPTTRALHSPANRNRKPINPPPTTYYGAFPPSLPSSEGGGGGGGGGATAADKVAAGVAVNGKGGLPQPLVDREGYLLAGKRYTIAASNKDASEDALNTELSATPYIDAVTWEGYHLAGSNKDALSTFAKSIFT